MSGVRPRSWGASAAHGGLNAQRHIDFDRLERARMEKWLRSDGMNISAWDGEHCRLYGFDLVALHNLRREMVEAGEIADVFADTAAAGRLMRFSVGVVRRLMK